MRTSVSGRLAGGSAWSTMRSGTVPSKEGPFREEPVERDIQDRPNGIGGNRFSPPVSPAAGSAAGTTGRDYRARARSQTRDLDLASVETAVKYEGYLNQEAARAQRTRREEGRPIPWTTEFGLIPGLSREVVLRLTQVRPETLGQAARIPGMTPAAVAVLGAYLSKPSRDADGRQSQ